MAIIISYPTANTVLLSDRLLGTKYDEELGTSATKNFAVGDIVTLATENTLSGGITDSFNVNYGGVIKQITVTNGLITNIAIVG
jgi:hypothetical protein